MSENQPRTRAEIQADIEKLQAELKAVPERKWKVGDRFYCEGKVTSEDDMNCAFVDVLLELERDETALYRAALIPAADLIPREEHEAALAEAVRQTERLDSDDAVHYLIRKLQDGWAHAPNIYNRVYTDGQQYRVTVERVEADAPEPADVEPVGWANRVDSLGWFAPHDTKAEAEEEAEEQGGVGEIAVPLYRHPAPTKLDANTALKYLVNEYDLDTGHMDSARPRTYPFDHNGHVYEVVVRRKNSALLESEGE